MMRGKFAVIILTVTAMSAPTACSMPSFTASTLCLGRRIAAIQSGSLTCQWNVPQHSLRIRHGGTAFATRHATTRASSRTAAKYLAIHSSHRILPLERPPDPSSLSSSVISEEGLSHVQNQTRILREWMRGKQSIVCLTGAGMSTESGIPDYRGAKGSYFRGHKPIIHSEFMSSPSQRKRYWARSLVGYSPFANAQPNLGHEALARLEDMKCIGVKLDECIGFDHLGDSCFGRLDGANGNERMISVITQNVDTLHSKAGLRNCLHLHGRGDLVRCMNCGLVRDRKVYHDQLSQLNREWLKEATSGSVHSAVNNNKDEKAELRPDGDAELDGRVSYEELILPPCPRCGIQGNSQNITVHDNYEQQEHSFFKTDVVFFGDSVPRHRFDISYAAVDAADGILAIGTSLAVHSAFRLVKRAIDGGTPVAILNVGETRVEREGLGDGLVLKLESPIGETLSKLVNMLDGDDHSMAM
mmetsp:Transcript_36321/g.87645  ORF Transcript_36321/g.87645 Transcript_36321/m.87645 type:complete len:471 (-) Transcript_36321:203-1615(-)